MAQGTILPDGPWQGVPPQLGSGLEQVLSSMMTPAIPQVTEHWPLAAQALQPPSTGYWRKAFTFAKKMEKCNKNRGKEVLHWVPQFAR